MAGSPLRPQDLQLQIDSSDTFDVREFVVDDGVNSLFAIDLLVRCENPAVDFEKTIGASATFRIGGDANSPKWSGIVSDIRQGTAEGTGLSTYSISLSPMMWLLGQRTNCRVFQQKTDLDVVLAMFDEWKLPHESKCKQTYKTKKYRVQYQETDFQFVCRLLEDSGISFVFEQRESGTVVVLHDAPESVEPRAESLMHVNDTSATNRSYATELVVETCARCERLASVELVDRIAGKKDCTRTPERWLRPEELPWVGVLRTGRPTDERDDDD